MLNRFPSLCPLLFLLLYLQFVTATPTNYTYDDTFGDSRTGQQVIYQPNIQGPWADQTCVGCAILPSVSQMMNGTYHAATWNPGEPEANITINFSGTAIYVYFTLINDPGAFPTGVTTTTTVNFILDQAPPSHFRYTPTGVIEYLFQYSPTGVTEYLFQYLAFTQDRLAEGNHTLVIAGDPSISYYINFDYAIYTYQDTLDNVLPSGPPSISASDIISTSNVITSTSPGLNHTLCCSTGQLGASSTVLANRPSSVYTGNTSPSKSTLPLPPPSWNPGQKIGVVLGSVIGGVLCMTACIFLARGVYHRRARDEHNARQLVPYTHQIEVDSEQTRQRLRPSEKRIDSTNQGRSHIHAARIARQGALDHRLITLAQEMLNMTAALSSQERELTFQQDGIPVDGNGDMTANELRGRISAMRTQAEYLAQQRHSDWAEGLTDDLPPGYTVENLFPRY